MSNTALAFLIAAITGLVVVLVVLLIRHRLRGRVGGRMKFALALASLALLIAITALDWPLASVSEFFSTHSVFTGMVTTLLLIGAGTSDQDSAPYLERFAQQSTVRRGNSATRRSRNRDARHPAVGVECV